MAHDVRIQANNLPASLPVNGQSKAAVTYTAAITAPASFGLAEVSLIVSIIAASLSAIWLALRIWESKTVQCIVTRIRDRD